MCFVTLVALVTFLAPKTAPSPLVRWVLYKSKLKITCWTDFKILSHITYDYFPTGLHQRSVPSMMATFSMLGSLSRWPIIIYKTLKALDVLEFYISLHTFARILHIFNIILHNWRILSQDSAMCLRFCQKDPACNFYKVES